MQATPCGLVTSSGKRETCGLYCLDHNPLMEGSSTCVQGVHRQTPCGLVTSSGERRDLWFVLFRS